ncbi:YegP family protein [Pseudarthrobacter sp. NS4]|uniref:YegP family protein n=1 Tax=Pseudarthrobacter sp. NS4 TaxID=2973976 RepID=UPI0021639F49|nr:DUF1508 domain-containing protein [Pseudarthrobacter sp. NS4]
MAGIFELFNDEDAQKAFRLKSPAGLVLAVSGRYPDKESAVQGIQDLRECAGTGLINDQCTPSGLTGPTLGNRPRSQRHQQ